jgi:hypothetical protein
MTARADWFIDGNRIREIMADPRECASRLLKALPREAQAAILAWQEFGQSGTITLQFSSGAVKGCDTASRHPVSGGSQTPQPVVPAAASTPTA